MLCKISDNLLSIPSSSELIDSTDEESLFSIKLILLNSATSASILLKVLVSKFKVSNSLKVSFDNLILLNQLLYYSRAF